MRYNFLKLPSPTVPKFGTFPDNFLTPVFPDWYPDDEDWPLSDPVSNELFDPVWAFLSDMFRFCIPVERWPNVWLGNLDGRCVCGKLRRSWVVGGGCTLGGLYDIKFVAACCGA